MDTALFSDTTDGCAVVTCVISDLEVSDDALTTVHIVKHVSVSHGLPCGVSESVFKVGDKKIH